MTHESIRKLIFIILFGFIIIALWAMGSSSGDQSESPSEVTEEVTYYEIKTVANVSSALSKVQDDISNAIPGCVSSVQNAVNTNTCVVTACDGGLHIGNNALNENDIFACVSEEYWEGFEGSYTAEENGCLANRCLNHDIDFSLSEMIETSKKIDSQITDIEQRSLDCVDVIQNDGSFCTVLDCDGVSWPGQGLLEQAQIDQCVGQGGDISNATAEQMGCLADECLNFTGESNQSDISSTNLDYSHINVGQSDPIVYTVEYELQKKGFFTLKPDQVFGYKTLDAIRLFQLSVGLSGTGKLDSTTMSKLLN